MPANVLELDFLTHYHCIQMGYTVKSVWLSCIIPARQIMRIPIPEVQAHAIPKII